MSDAHSIPGKCNDSACLSPSGTSFYYVVSDQRYTFRGNVLQHLWNCLFYLVYKLQQSRKLTKEIVERGEILQNTTWIEVMSCH